MFFLGQSPKAIEMKKNKTKQKKKTKQMGPNQTYKHSKGNHKKNKKTTYGKGKK